MVRRLIEKRKRGVAGWVMLGLFWLANGLMAAWLFSAMSGWGQMDQSMTDAQKAGAGIGMVMGLGIIFSIWACVAVVTGLFAYMTRGPKEITEIDD